MQKTEGLNWIHNLRTKWIIFRLLSIIAISLAITLVLSAIAVNILHLTIWTVPLVFLTVTTIILLINPVWKTSYNDVTRFVNNKYPEVEESADLLLLDDKELPMLQQFQRDKIEAVIPSLQNPKEIKGKIYSAALILIIALISSYGISKIPEIKHNQNQTTKEQSLIPAIKENILPEISDFNLTISPPTYTQKAARKQKTFSIKLEDGAKVNWQIETNIPVEK
ncbi:MAG: hypothetical protein EOO93_28900, partial [Pedobacter sp.]